MSLPDVSIIFGNGGLGRRTPTGDDCAAMIGNGVSPGSAPLLQLGTTYQLNSPDDAETLGITAAYDTANVVLVRYHINEFFRKNPNGSMWMMLVAQTVTLTQMADKANQYAYKLINDSFDVEGEIPARRLGIFRAPASGYSPTVTDGLDADVLTAIPKAKELMDQLDSEHAYLGSITIEGRAFTGTATNAENLRALQSGGIGCVIAQDKTIGDIDALHESHAALGTFLGDRSAAPVNADTMWVEAFNLQDAGLTKFIENGLSSNLLVSSYSITDQGTLHGKGYIFGRKLRGVPGVHWTGNPSCELEADDYAWLNDREVIAKCARLIYAALIPKLGRPVNVNATSGKLDPTFITYMEQLGHGSLAGMQSANEFSGKDVYINPAQNILVTSTLEVTFSITPTGTMRQITGKVQFTNPFSA